MSDPASSTRTARSGALESVSTCTTISSSNLVAGRSGRAGPPAFLPNPASGRSMAGHSGEKVNDHDADGVLADDK